MKGSALIWFRQDLRLHDNEALQTALRTAEDIVPVYVFDERVFKGKTHFGFPKTGKFRAKFILESVEDLRKNLRSLGSELLVRVGKPEEIIFEIARELRANQVICNRERTDEEVAVQDALEQNLWTIGLELWYTRGKMLYHTQDIPFPVQHTPDHFSIFRKENEQITPVREPLPTPTTLPKFNLNLEPGEMPTLPDFGHDDFENDPRAALQFKGGETTGLARLQNYFWETDHIATYKETRSNLLGEAYSTKFSPWLAQGCLSPKQIYHELRRYETERRANESTNWLIFELLWREYFRLMGKKFGSKIFQKSGPQGRDLPFLKNNEAAFEQWASGRTGVPFIDANLRELNATGYMSNRGRQNTASFLVRDLKVNWQMGAEYFESQLLDYDPTSNWGNWNYVAGVASDTREDRYYNILSQAKTYDPKGDFIRQWVEELAEVPHEKIHRPDLLTAAERERFGVGEYPKPMVKMEKWTI